MQSRRKWIRFSHDVEEVLVWTGPDASHSMKVIDESFGGISLRFDGSDQLEIGQVVEVEYKQVRMEASVKYLESKEDHCRVGLEWTTPTEST